MTVPIAGGRGFRAALLVSGLLHLATLGLLQDALVEERAQAVIRVRLQPVARFVPPRVVGGSTSTGPRTGGGGLTLAPDQLRSGEGPRAAPGVGFGAEAAPGGSLPPLGGGGGAGPPLSLREYSPGAKAETFTPERVTMVPLSELRPADGVWLPPTDLLRLEDLAHASARHALVIPDPNSRRDLTGYLNLTRVRVHGAGRDSLEWLDGLARFARDNSLLLVRINGAAVNHLRSPELLKDPVIFLVQDAAQFRAPGPTLTHFSEEEKALLKTYLQSGGFLFIEGTPPNSNQFLREMADLLQTLLGSEAEVAPLPADHPLYSAYYDYTDGMPGEQGKTDMAPAAGSPLRPYPAQEDAPCGAVGGPRPLGLWGVRWRGQTVALLSDICLHFGWAGGLEGGATGALAAGLNILVYALTREGTLTTHQQRPAWMTSRPQAPVALERREGREAFHSRSSQAAGPSGAEADVPLDADLLNALDAFLAVVRVPLGTTGEDQPLLLRLNGVYSLELPRMAGHGVLLHNLPPGRHWLEVRYAGSTRQVELDLPGGRVTTVTFGVSRLLFLRQLRLTVGDRRERLNRWLAQHGDLELEEQFVGDDRELVESAAQLLRQ